MSTSSRSRRRGTASANTHGSRSPDCGKRKSSGLPLASADAWSPRSGSPRFRHRDDERRPDDVFPEFTRYTPAQDGGVQIGDASEVADGHFESLRDTPSSSSPRRPRSALPQSANSPQDVRQRPSLPIAGQRLESANAQVTRHIRQTSTPSAGANFPWYVVPGQ